MGSKAQQGTKGHPGHDLFELLGAWHLAITRLLVEDCQQIVSFLKHAFLVRTQTEEVQHSADQLRLRHLVQHGALLLVELRFPHGVGEVAIPTLGAALAEAPAEIHTAAATDLRMPQTPLARSVATAKGGLCLFKFLRQSHRFRLLLLQVLHAGVQLLHVSFQLLLLAAGLAFDARSSRRGAARSYLGSGRVLVVIFDVNKCRSVLELQRH
mmetsp:Transcript_118316/g.280868  ORF Transcript_118316/g.280868 Transcript_118316/m.280868 type:complete len:211 (+) Transcript_118316:172-804(+)